VLLRLTIWIGLTAGFLDLGLVIVKSRFIEGDFYRLGSHFVWIIPAGVGVLVLLFGAALVLTAWLRRGAISLGVAVGLLSFVGFLELCARLPMHQWAALLLSGGFAVQLARRVGPRSLTFMPIVRRTAPLLVGTLLAIMLWSFGRLAWLEHRAAAALPAPPPAARNVLLIVWDTVRAANLTLQGYGRPTTTTLKQLANSGVRFDLAFATSPWTLPSHATLFTGRWPHELRVDWKVPMDETFPTLAEYLGRHGYDTAGFVANLEYCSSETGLGRGFAHYDDYPLSLWDSFSRYVAIGRRIYASPLVCMVSGLLGKHKHGTDHVALRAWEHAKSAAALDRAFLDWLTWQQSRGRPFFAFLNYADAHTPYEIPDRLVPGFGLRPESCKDVLTLTHWNTLDKTRLPIRNIQMATDVYDDCIFYLDRRLEILLQELGRRRVLDDTLVIVTSDHGEHLGDHRLFFHGCSLYRQLVQVPLVMVDPKGISAGRVVAEPVSLRDLPATVADLVGLSRDAPFPGRSLARFWGKRDGAESLPAKPLLMETGKPILLTNQGREPAAKGPMESLIAWGMHYVRTANGLEELYLLQSDPEERENVAGLLSAQETLVRFRHELSSLLRVR
jgi:arylsulfatase A-like enzyme